MSPTTYTIKIWTLRPHEISLQLAGSLGSGGILRLFSARKAALGGQRRAGSMASAGMSWCGSCRSSSPICAGPARPGRRSSTLSTGYWHDLGVSKSFWDVRLPRQGPTISDCRSQIVSTRKTEHFPTTPGDYFHGMVAKHIAGELNLGRTVWALRRASEPERSERGRGPEEDDTEWPAAAHPGKSRISSRSRRSRPQHLH